MRAVLTAVPRVIALNFPATTSSMLVHATVPAASATDASFERRARTRHQPIHEFPLSPSSEQHAHCYLMVVCFDVVPCVECDASFLRTMCGKALSVDDSRLMSVAISDHALTKVNTGRNLG